jgi:hypothetical protein
VAGMGRRLGDDGVRCRGVSRGHNWVPWWS